MASPSPLVLPEREARSPAWGAGNRERAALAGRISTEELMNILLLEVQTSQVYTLAVVKSCAWLWYKARRKLERLYLVKEHSSG